MRVLLVRHGEAVSTDTASSEPLRWLTEAGRRTVKRVGRALAELQLEYTSIHSSPLVRALQTAEILASTSPGFYGPVEVHPPLSSDEGTTAQALAPLGHAADGDLVVLVSHMPKVGTLAGHLCQTTRVPPFRTGSACLIRLDARRGIFEWTMDPDTLELGASH